MKFKNIFNLNGASKRIFAGFVVVSMMVSTLPLGIKANAAEVTTLITDYRPIITETIDASGFKHPGIGLTKDILENMKTEVLAQKEPWYSYYIAMTKSSNASKTVTSSNRSSVDPTKPASTAFDSQGFNSGFIADGLKAYTQALMYYITGDEVYRTNAMSIIRIWSQMDPTKYKYFTDSHIHTGIPLNRMVTAAEILRYTSCETEALKWTDKDTTDFTNNLINPVIETFQHSQNYFMNQHNYPLLGAMAGYIFTGNKGRYDEAVEWFTVNKTAIDQGQNGSVKQLFRLVDTNIVTGEKVDPPVVQHVEMGRDQAHGGGDLTNSAIISRMLLAQGTKVDPAVGTVSAASNAVNPYEFLDNRILKAANYFWQYMLGYNTPWIPVAAHTDVNGNPTIIYNLISDFYRGRMTTANFWDIYYYYRYTVGANVEEIAPYFAEAFSKRIPSNYYFQGALAQAWDCVDGGGDFWLYIPKAAEAEGAQNLPKEQPDAALIQLEERYTAFDANSSTKQEGDTSYIEVNTTEEGSKIGALNVSYANRTQSRIIGLKFRTNGTAKLELVKEYGSAPYHTLLLPDTNGQWRYMNYDMNINTVPYSKIDENFSILFMNIKGDNTKVDIDALNVQAGTQLTPPKFKSGNTELKLLNYIGTEKPITFDFSATDTNTSYKITYQIDNKPEGAELDVNTGAFSWKPTQVGTYSFLVSASDGTSVTTKNVIVEVTNDRQSLVASVASLYDSDATYVSSSIEAYNNAYNSIINLMKNSATEDDFYLGLSNLKSAVDNLKLLTPLLSDGSLNYASIVNSTAGNKTSTLVDGDDSTYPELQLAPDFYHIFDFGYNFKVLATAFAVASRRSFPERIGGTIIFGSNDGEAWTRLTADQAKSVEGLQTLEVMEEYKNAKFRYIKMHAVVPATYCYEPSEFRIYGQRYEIITPMESVSISSDKSFINRIVPGDTLKLTFKAKEEINSVKVNIQGQEATVSTADNINWTSEIVMNENMTEGNVKFSINYKTKDGSDAPEMTSTTDYSKLFLVSEKDLIKDVTSITNLIDPSTHKFNNIQRPNAEVTLQQANFLFDGKAETNSDFRNGSNGAGAYITFDFKEGNTVVLSKVELLARQDTNFGRIKGVVIQGSNNNSTWTTISPAASATKDWQTLAINSTVPYRYIRIYNSNSWYGNMAEVRFHKDINPPVTTDDAPTGWVNQDNTIHFSAKDAESKVAATYYKLDDNEQQEGSEVTLTTEGVHTLVYWSVDIAGNAEQPHAATVKVDKTAPEITVDGFDKQSLSDALDIIPTVTLKDNFSGVDTSKTQLLLDGSPYNEGEKIQLYRLPLGNHTFVVNSSDLAGNTGSHTVTFVTYASVEGLKQLVVRFAANNWIDNEGIINSLQKKLLQNDLQSFIQEVQAQSGKHINSEAASYLLRNAQAILP